MFSVALALIVKLMSGSWYFGASAKLLPMPTCAVDPVIIVTRAPVKREKSRTGYIMALLPLHRRSLLLGCSYTSLALRSPDLSRAAPVGAKF